VRGTAVPRCEFIERKRRIAVPRRGFIERARSARSTLELTLGREAEIKLLTQSQFDVILALQDTIILKSDR
jgi:hypothetical protein